MKESPIFNVLILLILAIGCAPKPYLTIPQSTLLSEHKEDTFPHLVAKVITPDPPQRYLASFIDTMDLGIKDPHYANEIAEIVTSFYRLSHYQPVWYSLKGPNRDATFLIDQLLHADRHGLDPFDYNVYKLFNLQLKTYHSDTIHASAVAFLDLKTTISYITFVLHLKYGKTPPILKYGMKITIQADENFARKLFDQNVNKAIDALLPKGDHYKNTMQALARYRELMQNNEWKPLPTDLGLKRGDSSEFIPIMAKHLLLTGDLKDSNFSSNVVNEDFEGAIKHFQIRHGLEADGIIGKSTIQAFNIPMAEKVKTLELNLERMRWMPDDPGAQYILVNIPAYELLVIKNNKKMIQMRTIVGNEESRTPMFYDNLEYIVFSPTWTIPKSIIMKEMYPKIKTDPGYLTRSGYQLYLDWKETSEPVDPTTLDWEAIDPNTANLKIVQPPGPQNALGLVKFIMPNSSYIYLHDTPSDNLFVKTDRAFSHGCIRLERPADLAYYLLQDMDDWTRAKVEESMGRNEPQKVYLTEPIPVYLIYQTAWAEKNKMVHFRKDIYGYDR